MVKIPDKVLGLKIEAEIENKVIEQSHRAYLGMSMIGHSCARALWYNFRWASPRTISTREARLFKRGHREEPIVIKDLREAGVKVFGQQRPMVTGHGHIRGHNDGICNMLPDAPKTDHLLEIKTANDNNFKKIKKEGVEKAKPIYYGQAQCYMAMLKLKRALFVVVNKNNDARHYERIRFDRKKAEELFSRGIDIISTEIPPPRIGSSTWYECKWCDHYEVCHFDKKPETNCRTCQHADLLPNQWRCSRDRKRKGYDKQTKGCIRWQILKGLQK